MKAMTKIFMAALAACAFCAVPSASAQEQKDGSTVEVKKLSAEDGAPVLVIGDSMMRLLGVELEKKLKNAYIKPVKAYSSLGSGLARIDAMDWFEKAQSLMDEMHPKIAVVCIGANDKQTMHNANGDNLIYGTKEWTAEYTARIEKLMKILETGGKGVAPDGKDKSPDGKDRTGAQEIVWLLLPDMREPGMQEFAVDVNSIVTKVAAKPEHKKFVFVNDMRQILERKPGTFSPYMIDRFGNSLKVRDDDGVHLALPGAKVVAESLVKTYWK